MDDITHINNYYKIQSKFYDITRPFFLEGRIQLISKINEKITTESKVLEVGCGTAYLLSKIKSNNKIGLDLSQDMLNLAKKKYPDLNFINSFYKEELFEKEEFDVIYLSYVITLNTSYQSLLDNIKYHLKPDGKIFVLDFNKSNFEFYQKFMNSSKVFLRDEILEDLKTNFPINNFLIKNTFSRIWSFFIFEGTKEGNKQ